MVSGSKMNRIRIALGNRVQCSVFKYAGAATKPVQQPRVALKNSHPVKLNNVQSLDDSTRNRNTDSERFAFSLEMNYHHWLTAGDFLSESWFDGVLPCDGPTPGPPRSPTPPPHEFVPGMGESAWKPWLSWSSELAASYWVFSSRVISLSSSSPNSPPISVGSPTTITSCKQQFSRREEKHFFIPVPGKPEKNLDLEISSCLVPAARCSPLPRNSTLCVSVACLRVAEILHRQK